MNQLSMPCQQSVVPDGDGSSSRMFLLDDICPTTAPDDSSAIFFSLGGSFTEQGTISNMMMRAPKKQNDHCSPPFPWKVHEMLNDAASEGIDSIVSWLPDGKSFKVFNTKLFVELIMPRYFNQTKYKSFQRQLNMWDFERIQEGSERGGYSHAFLDRSNVSLCRYMKRTKVKGNQPRFCSLTGNLKTKTSITSRVISVSPPPAPPLTPQVTQEEQDFQVVTPPLSSRAKVVSVPSSLNIVQGTAVTKLRETSPSDQIATLPVFPTLAASMDEIMEENDIFFSSSGAAVSEHDGECMFFEGRKFHSVDDYHPISEQ